MLSAMLVDHLQSLVHKNRELWSKMDNLNSFAVFQNYNCIWLIQFNISAHGILHNINKYNFYSKQFKLQKIIHDTKWENNVICGEFILLALLINCKYITNYLLMFQH